MTDLVREVALRLISIAGCYGKEVGGAANQVCDSGGRQVAYRDVIRISAAGWPHIEPVLADAAAGAGIPGQSQTAVSLRGNADCCGEERNP